MNPLYSPADGPNNATRPDRAVNKQYPDAPRSSSSFDLSRFQYQLQRYGVITPFEILEVTGRDIIPLHNSHSVRSLALRSPFLAPLTLSKDNFYIPMQAILPRTWEYIFRQEAQGDECPEDANCYVNNLHQVVYSLLSDIKTICAAGSLTSATLSRLIYDCLAVEQIASKGSLLESMNYHNLILVGYTDGKFTLDHLLDTIYSTVLVEGSSFVFNTVTYYIGTPSIDFNPPQDISKIYCTPAQFLDLLRENFANMTIRGTDTSAYIVSAPSASLTTIQNNLNSLELSSIEYSFMDKVNIGPLLAYQLACWQFYVNPNVDFVYNAEIWRNLIYSNMRTLAPSLTEEAKMFFTMNGVSMLYDIFSNHTMQPVFDSFLAPSKNLSTLQDAYSFIRGIFGMNNCLVYGDYFTGSRTRPLGVGDINAPVVNSKVSAVDMSKSIIMQRFLNSVVKIGNSFSDYLRGIFSSAPGPDYHHPIYVSHNEFKIDATETTNTASNQGAVTSQLMAGADTMQYQCEIDMPGYLLGVSYFRAPRVYSLTRDKMFSHITRYDYFLPFMQFIGDQVVEKQEFNCAAAVGQPYGYQTRHMEYKQRYSFAAGDFGQLPGWINDMDSIGADGVITTLSLNQGPDSLRTYPFEFDRFFKGFGGLSLAHHFHFIVGYDNKVPSQRPMIVSPNTL